MLEVRGIFAGYEQTAILSGVSIEVASHEIVTVVGPNGAGKSTLLKAVFGLLRPTHGDILLEGRSIVGLKPSALVRHGVAFVPQVENVFPSLTVLENLQMGGAPIKSDLQRQIATVQALFPILFERQSAKAKVLSGGERQMLAIGRALMVDPKLLLLDEPSAGLAPRMVELVFEKVVEINRTGVSVLLIEQNVRAALKMSHRGYILVSGRNRGTGVGRELLADIELGALYFGG